MVDRLLRGLYYYRAGMWLTLWLLNNVHLAQMGFGTTNAAGGLNVLGLIVYFVVKRRRRKRTLRLLLEEASSAEIRLKGASVFFSWLLWVAFWVAFCGGVNAFVVASVLTPFVVILILGFVGDRRFDHKLRSAIAEEAADKTPSSED